jgi:tetratricopeptide (TPR) repeat protein/transcriptional regulator with XRE-family HTH domain
VESAGAAARLGGELRRMRRQLGLSQRFVVRAVGLSAHSNLVQYELGRRIPPGDVLLALQQLFGDASGSLRRLRAEALMERAQGPAVVASSSGAATEPATTAIPAMLPPPVADFTGRAPQLLRLEALTRASAGSAPTAVVITAIAGTAGVGKTALAVHFAHRIRHRFPDGQLYVNLRGYAPTPPMRCDHVLAVFLQALGIHAEAIPADQDAAVGLYRSLLADRRVLVVLDNAHDPGQVRPLLPASPSCVALVTSRDRLTGLAARDGARRLTLDTLTAAESRTLLGKLLDPVRVAAEPAAVDDLASVCAKLPLALRIAAANLTNRPHTGVARYVDELRTGNRLAALTADGDEQAAVRAAFDLSYATLTPDARRMFRLLGLTPGPDITAEAAAPLADMAVADAQRLLDRLAAGHLVEEHQPGRYTFHDLLRTYALERAELEDDQHVRAADLQRLLYWYLQAADAAAGLLYPDVLRLPVPPPATDVTPVNFADNASALAWMDAELLTLVAAARHAAEHGPHAAGWLLADVLRFYFIAHRPTAEWQTVAEAGLAAAEAAGDLPAQAIAQLSLADNHQFTGHLRAATVGYTRTLALARLANWPHCQAAALGNLGMVHQRSGQLRKAIEHYTRALALDRQTGRLLGQATNLSNLGRAYKDLGRLALSADCSAQTVGMYRRVGSPYGESNALANLSDANQLLGSYDLALDQATEAVAIQRKVGDRLGEAHTLLTIVTVYRDRGKRTYALEVAHTALALARDTHECQVTTAALNVLGTIYRDLGRDQEADDHHQQALSLARQTGEPYSEVEALLGLAVTHLGEHADRTSVLARRALTIARRHEYRMLEGRAHTCLARIHLLRGDPRRGARLGWQALAIHRETGHRLGEARTLLLLGHALRERDRSTTSARESWERALALFTTMRTPEAGQVRTLLHAS